ncbi:MAG: ABC transporter ATP-binding protein [Clostridia bacterium]
MKAIETVNLTKFYGKNRGISEVNLKVEEGEYFGFIGPNGAGKSTTIRTLLGLIQPTGGSAEIFGKDVVKEKTEVLSLVGYLPSEAVFYPGMRVKDLLKFSADLRKKNCRKEAQILCERLNLDPTKRIGELSFGNRKKTAIVCALQHKPKLLILDEPTGGLDPLMQREFFGILRERAEEGTTIFLSSHILSEIQKNCGRAAIIREGKIIACGSVESLAKTGAKRVTVQGKADWSAFPGIRDFQKDGDTVHFLYNGNINELTRKLAQFELKDLSVSEPDLEEIFLHYYAEEGGEV